MVYYQKIKNKKSFKKYYFVKVMALSILTPIQGWIGGCERVNTSTNGNS